MGCVQAKAAAPAETPVKLPTLLSKTKTGISNVGQNIAKGAVDTVTAVGHGASNAATAVGNGAQQMGSGAVGAVRHAGEGAVAAVKRAGTGLAGPSSEPEVEAQPEKTWYERLLTFDPWACCCQPPSAGNMLGSLVRGALANFDSSALGVEIELGALVIDPATGRIEVEGLTVRNPEGWSSEYLLHADKIVVDIEMEKLLYSFGKELDVQELVFDGVDVIYEKGLSTSNLNDLLKILESNSSAAETERSAAETKQAEASDVKLVLHTILAQNIGAKLATKLTGGHGLRLEVGDLKYDDFDTEMGAGRGLMDVVRILIMTLVKSVLATVMGKENTKAIAGAANNAKDKLKSMSSDSVEVVRTGCLSRKGSKVSGQSSQSLETATSTEAASGAVARTGLFYSKGLNIRACR
eukprot:TRINITY_DN4222_c0_g1_i6.p1 TRINITY_DN4222_c0_g1~~TRINITY_DN4222_c0_g1_i6.p1  ORF type:complete len:409 (+),score=87.92 TRINITY_DN4222_c0_g1_i6:76-1302(+)